MLYDIDNNANSLKKTLSFSDLVIYGMVFMIPIAPFAIYGYVSDISNGMVPLAYLIGLIGMFFTAYSYKLMSGNFRDSGTVYTYAKNCIGEFAGFFSGWMLILDYLLIPALTYVVAAAALSQIFPEISRWIWVLVFLSSGTIANFFGMQLTAKMNKLFLVIQLALITTFIIIGTYTLYHGVGATKLSLAPFYQPEHFNIGMVFSAISVCALSFLGFDAIATLSEEVKSTRKNVVGNATLCALFIIGIIFIAQTWVASDLANGMKFSSPDTAFYEIVNATEGKTLSTIAAFFTAIMFGVSCSMVSQSAIARLLFAMSRDGIIPQPFSKLHPKFRTPTFSLLMVAGVSLILSLFFIDKIDILASFINFGAITGFIILHISVLYFYFKNRVKLSLLTHFIFPILGIFILGYVLYSMGKLTWELGLCWLVLGVIYYIVVTRVMHRKVTFEI